MDNGRVHGPSAFKKTALIPFSISTRSEMGILKPKPDARKNKKLSKAVVLEISYN